LSDKPLKNSGLSYFKSNTNNKLKCT